MWPKDRDRLIETDPPEGETMEHSRARIRLVPLPFLVRWRPIQPEVECVLNVFIEANRHVSRFRTPPGLTELSNDRGGVEARLLGQFPLNRILGRLGFEDAASWHLRPRVDVDMVEDQEPSAGIGHEGDSSLIALRVPTGHRNVQKFAAAVSLRISGSKCSSGSVS